VETALEEVASPPAPPAVAEPVAVAEPEPPEAPPAPPVRVEIPLADPAGPLAVPDAVRAEVAAKSPDAVEATEAQ